MADQEVKYRIVVEGAEEARRKVQGAMGGSGGGGAPGGGPSIPGAAGPKMKPEDEEAVNKMDWEGLTSKMGPFISGSGGVETLFAGTSMAGLAGVAASLMAVVAPMTLGISLVTLKSMALGLQNYSAGLFRAGTEHEMFTEGFKFRFAGMTEESLSKLIRNMDALAERAMPLLVAATNATADGFGKFVENMGPVVSGLGKLAELFGWMYSLPEKISGGNETLKSLINLITNPMMALGRGDWISDIANMFGLDEDSDKSKNVGERMRTAGLDALLRASRGKGRGTASTPEQFVDDEAYNQRGRGSTGPTRGFPVASAPTMNFTMADQITIQAADEEHVHEEMLALKNDVLDLFQSMRSARWMRLARERMLLRGGMI